MSQDDNDLDKLLKPLRELSPGDLQMQKWQTAVQFEARIGRSLITTTRSKWVFQLVAAMFIGFVIGALLNRSSSVKSIPNPTVAQILINNATFEHSHANLD